VATNVLLEDSKKKISKWLFKNGGTSHSTFATCDETITTIKISPSGDQLLAGCQNGAVYAWNMSANQLFKLNINATISGLGYAFQGKIFLVSSLDNLQVFMNDGTRKQISKFVSASKINNLATDLNTNKIAISTATALQILLLDNK